MRCSVVFGLTLRLLVINISSSSHAINTAAYYHRCVTTCETVAVVHRRPCLQHLPVAPLTQAVKPDIDSESQFLRTPPAFDVPVKGGGFLSEYRYAVWHEKLEWCGYPMLKKIEDMCIRFVIIHDRDGHTDRQTDTA